MSTPNYKQIFAKKKNCEDKIIKICPKAQHASGIYAFYREDENGFKYAYVGQATDSVLRRMAEHLLGYQHIDLSIKKHKFYNEQSNIYGYKAIVVCYCPPNNCDSLETEYIKKFADKGYQMRNHTSGSQGKGKATLDIGKSTKGYRQGLEQGEKNLAKKVANWFDKHLIVKTKKEPPTANQQKALDKFNNIINNINKEEQENENI